MEREEDQGRAARTRAFQGPIGAAWEGRTAGTGRLLVVDPAAAAEGLEVREEPPVAILQTAIVNQKFCAKKVLAY